MHVEQSPLGSRGEIDPDDEASEQLFALGGRSGLQDRPSQGKIKLRSSVKIDCRPVSEKAARQPSPSRVRGIGGTSQGNKGSGGA